MDKEDGEPFGTRPDEAKKLPEQETRSFKQACQHYSRMRALSRK
jgi:hypothetical protein